MREALLPCPGSPQTLCFCWLHHIVQRAHFVTVKHIIPIARYKHDLQFPVEFPDPAGSLHPVQIRHFHIQKEEVDFARMAAQPAHCAAASRKLVYNLLLLFVYYFSSWKRRFSRASSSSSHMAIRIMSNSPWVSHFTAHTR